MKKNSYKESSEFLQEKIKAIIDRPLTSREISLEAQIDFKNVQYHLKRLIERKEILCVEDLNKPASHRWTYLVAKDGNGGRVTVGESSTDYIVVDKFGQFKPKGAMGRVKDLDKKLKEQNELINSDRHRAIQRSRGGCAGISQVYEG